MCFLDQQSHLRLKYFFHVHVIVTRIHFLTIVQLKVPFSCLPSAKHSPLIYTYHLHSLPHYTSIFKVSNRVPFTLNLFNTLTPFPARVPSLLNVCLIQSSPPRIICHQGQLIWDINYTSKIPSQQHLGPTRLNHWDKMWTHSGPGMSVANLEICLPHCSPTTMVDLLQWWSSCNREQIAHMAENTYWSFKEKAFSPLSEIEFKLKNCGVHI